MSALGKRSTCHVETRFELLEPGIITQRIPEGHRQPVTGREPGLGQILLKQSDGFVVHLKHHINVGDVDAEGRDDKSVILCLRN